MPSWPSIQARYNVAPTAMLDGLIYTEGLQHASMHWGLIPSWARPGQFSAPLINARSETVWEKPSFRNLIRKQRVCVPINGFYEWHRAGDNKTPYYFYPADNRAMLVAGIYQKTSNERVDVTLLTTDASSAIAHVHHRMPVIIQPDDAVAWLTNDDRDYLTSLMHPAANDFLAFHEISDYVNNARHEGPDCIATVA